LIAVVSPVPTVKLASALVPPMMPPKLTLPLLFAILNAFAPFIVLTKLMPLAPVEVRVTGLAPKVTALLYVCAPVVVVAVVLIAVASLVPTVKLVKAVEPPTMPPKLTAPLLFAILNACAPFNVLTKLIPLEPVEVKVTGPAPKVTALL